jgi:hypothetical protein
VADFPELGPLIPGGIAFAVVGATATFDRGVLARLNLPPHSGWSEAVAHGCGRALWFLAMHNPRKIEALVDAHPDWREHLLAGVGIAVGFTQVYRPENIVSSIDSFAPEHRSMVTRGAMVALASMPLDNPAALPHVEAAVGGRLRGVYDRVRDAMRAATPGDQWYPSFVARVREISVEDAGPAPSPGERSEATRRRAVDEQHGATGLVGEVR